MCLSCYKIMWDLFCSIEFFFSFHILFVLYVQWKDSIDDSDGETGDEGEVRGERVVVSPWKRNQGGGGRRTKIPWSTAETLAVMKGYEKYLKPESSLRFQIEHLLCINVDFLYPSVIFRYGADWKRIKDECPILVRRTNVRSFIYLYALYSLLLEF